MRIADLLSQPENDLREGDYFDIELEDLIIESYVVGFTRDGVVIAGDDTVLGYVSAEELTEAEYQGKEVPLGKKLPGDVKKSKVYVRKPNGKVVKVNFGDKKMRIKKSNPARRKSFRARHKCSTAKPGTARYMACKDW